MNSRNRKFLSYYKPYLRLVLADVLPGVHPDTAVMHALHH